MHKLKQVGVPTIPNFRLVFWLFIKLLQFGAYGTQAYSGSQTQDKMLRWLPYPEAKAMRGVLLIWLQQSPIVYIQNEFAQFLAFLSG